MNEQYGSYVPTQEESSAVHEVILDNSFIIDELMHTLRGEIVDTNTNQIIQQGDPLVDENAITWLVGRFVPYTSKIFSLSVLDEREIKQIIYEFESEISLELMFPDNLGIKRKNRDYVKWLLVHAFVATMYKALAGETLKKLLEQHHVSETTVRQENEKRSFWNRNKEVNV
jgi:hypothetical protein